MNDVTIPDLPDGADGYTAALAYARGGSYVVPLRQRTKNPGILLGDKWHTKTVRHDADVYALWMEEHPGSGVGLHAGRSGLTIVDVDVPGRLDERIRQAIIELRPPFQTTRQHRHGYDPATALATGDLRGHAIFRTPPGRMLGNSLGRLTKGWGEIRGNNGIIVVAPTLHEKSDGRYAWIRTGPVPLLPAYITDELPEGADAENAATDEQVAAFKAAYAYSPRNGVVAIDAVVATFRQTVADGEGRHTAAITHATWMAREARAGMYGAGIAFEELYRAFHAFVSETPGSAKGRLREGGIRREFNGILAWAVGQVIATDQERIEQVQTRAAAHRAARGQAPAPVAAPPAPVAAQTAPGEPPAGDLWATGVGEPPPGLPVADEPDAPRASILPTLPDSFWQARPYLQQIRQAAHARGAAADVVFHATLARLSGMLPHWAKVDTGIGAPAPLNYFAAIVSDSGVGKSSDFSVARSLLQRPSGVDFVDEAPLGSGEGIAELFMGEVEAEEHTDGSVTPWSPAGAVAPASGPQGGRGGGAGGKGRAKKTEKVRAQVRHNAFITADEGTAMTELMHGRKGSTLGSTLRTAWSGGTLGNANATKERHRIIPEGSYSIGMCVGFQRITVEPLLNDSTAGTPQRFAWVAAVDPNIPRQRPRGARLAEHALIWDWTIFGRPGARDAGMTIDEDIQDELWAERRAKKAGELVTEPLDSHKPLFMVKVAGLLAVLDKRNHITREDWDLAGVVWAGSVAVRSALLDHLAQTRVAEARLADESAARRQVRMVEAVDQAKEQAVFRVARRVGIAVHATPDGQTPAVVHRKLAARDRHHFEAALQIAIGLLWVVESDGVLKPGESKPGDG